MAQYATPSADITDGNWVDHGASNVDMYLDIVPGTPGTIGSGDDTTYIESEANPSSSASAFDLSTVSDPVSSSSHILRWRRAKDAASGGQIDLTVQIRQGYTGEGSQGTEITSQSDTNLSETFATATPYTLSGVEADSITDYSDLQVRFVANQST
jgi:hypothetical protein